MVNVPTFENVPNFGSASAKTQPEPSTYVGGYIPGQVFPAEHENWFMAALTTNGNTQQSALISVVSELDTILSAASITPASGLVNQVYTALNALFATVGALATEITNRQNADALRAPIPISSSGLGQFVLISGSSTNAGGNGKLTLPSGGFWVWSYTSWRDSNNGASDIFGVDVNSGGPTAGGTQLTTLPIPGSQVYLAKGWAWRVG